MKENERELDPPEKGQRSLYMPTLQMLHTKFLSELNKIVFRFELFVML